MHSILTNCALKCQHFKSSGTKMPGGDVHSSHECECAAATTVMTAAVALYFWGSFFSFSFEISMEFRGTCVALLHSDQFYARHIESALRTKTLVGGVRVNCEWRFIAKLKMPSELDGEDQTERDEPITSPKSFFFLFLKCKLMENMGPAMNDICVYFQTHDNGKQ